jgi:hypothetical protein
MHTKPSIPTPALGIRIARAERVRRGAVAALAALAGAALISACGGSSSSSSSAKTNVNTARVAESIEKSVLSERHLHSTVVCPKAVPQEAGRTFECIATTKSTKAPFTVVKTPFVVTVQSSKGYVTYEGK